MATGTVEQLLGQKPLGTAIGASDLAAIAAAKGSDGTRKALVLNSDNELTVADATARTSLAAIASALSGEAGQATAAKQDTGNTSLASIDGKIPAAPSTAGNQASIISGLSSIDGHVDGLEALAGTTNAALASILAKLLAAPATEAKQDSGNTSLSTIAGKDFATQTTLAEILVKLADPATQVTLAAVLAKLSSDPATQTTLAAVLAKLTSDPATQTTLAAILTAVQGATPAGSNIIGKVSLDQTTPGTTDRATVGKTTYIDVTLSLDTSAYAAGDLLADTQAIANMTRVADLGGVLQTIQIIDKDDQGAAFDIYFLDANNTFGTENSAPSITDANAAAIFGKVSVATTDYTDLGGVRVATISNCGLAVKPVSGTNGGYLAVINGSGTPTFTASGVVLRLGILQD